MDLVSVYRYLGVDLTRADHSSVPLGGDATLGVSALSLPKVPSDLASLPFPGRFPWSYATPIEYDALEPRGGEGVGASARVARATVEWETDSSLPVEWLVALSRYFPSLRIEVLYYVDELPCASR